MKVQRLFYKYMYFAADLTGVPIIGSECLKHYHLHHKP